MKQTSLAILVAATLTVALSTTAFAQTRKSQKMTVQTTTATTYAPSYYANNEVTALLGMTAGALNLGADYARMNGNWGGGGYFFLQLSKDKNGVPAISQIMSFGGLLKVNLVDANNVRVFIAPGAGITMVKDGSNNGTSKSDETVIGPIWKMGVTYKTDANFNIGLETLAFGNFFNDNLNNYAGPSQYYSVAMGFAF
ncbi:MAG: hypothetical protein H7328_11575 [Bdellovibrio sp.]|nr:hypothetical protein [Bdellovibrio sp.]